MVVLIAAAREFVASIMSAKGQPTFAATVWQKIRSEPAWFWTLGLMAYFLAVLLGSMKGQVHGDVRLYHQIAVSIWHGQMPYRDFVLEYPPYAIPFFLPPGIFSGLDYYKIAFAWEVLALDALVKVVLLWLGLRHGKRVLLPMICFSLGCAFNHYFYLQRFDLVPAAISLAMIVAFWKKKPFLAGVLLAFGAGVKLYPVLFLPPLLALAWRQRRAVRFMAGVGTGLLPLALLTLVMPWGRFLSFHTGRGLQVESIYAALLWFLHHFGL
ncbi:MAG TPA: glycosyltransferase 87 family protein, partial [Verrucomicrobiae bacterium]